MSLADKLQTIAENEQKVYKAGQIAILKNSKYMNAKESGSIITVNDVSPVEHNLDIKFASKNLLDSSTILDGYEILKDEIVSNANWYVVSADVLPNTQYVISGFSSFARIEEDIEGNRTRPNDGSFFTTSPTTVKVYFNSNKSEYGNNQLEIGTTATPYTPYIGDFSGVNVTRCGKNFFDADTVLPSLTNPNYPSNHWAKQEDGSFYIFNVGLLHHCVWFENTSGYKGQMAISITGRVYAPEENAVGLILSFVYTDNTTDSIRMPCSEEYVTKTLVSNPNKTVAYIRQSYADIAGVYIKDIMLSYGTDTEYEPYNPYTVTANADGTVDLTSISPNMTLYTDADGVSINCQYYRDIDLYIDNLITDIALTGGE